MKRILPLMFIALFLVSCANTRDPHCVSLIQNNDTEMSCQLLLTEYSTNTLVAESKITKNNKDDVQDVVVGALIWPGLADFKNADGIEGNALIDRNVRLLEIAKMNNCDTSEYPLQPVRYD